MEKKCQNVNHLLIDLATLQVSHTKLEEFLDGFYKNGRFGSIQKFCTKLKELSVWQLCCNVIIVFKKRHYIW